MFSPNSLQNHVFIQFVNLEIFLNSVSYSFSRSSSTTSYLTSLYLIYCPYNRIYRSFLYMLKSLKPIFHHFFYYRRYPNTLSNIVIFNLISSSHTTYTTQHRLLCCTYFTLALILNRPTLCPVQYRGSYRCLIKCSL